MRLLEKLKYNIWVFFTRIKTKDEIEELTQHLNFLSWYIGVEKLNDPILVKMFEETRLALAMNELILKNLRYDPFKISLKQKKS